MKEKRCHNIMQVDLRQVQFFRDLDQSQLDELERSMHPMSYEARQLILHEGGPVKGLYIVLDGFVVYGKHTARGNKQRLLKILSPGDVFGEENILGTVSCACQGFARALSETSLLLINKTDLLNFMQQHPVLYQALSELLTRELQVLECKLVEISYESIEQNLLRVLYILIHSFGERVPEGIMLQPELSRQDLSELVGAHVDSVAHVLAKWRDRNLLTFADHRIVVVDEEQLRELANPETTCTGQNIY